MIHWHVDDYLKLHEVSNEVSIYKKKVQGLSSGLRSGHKKPEKKLRKNY